MLRCKDKSGLPPEPSLKAGECLSQPQAMTLWEHQNDAQLTNSSKGFISLSDALLRKMFITHEKERKQPVSQGLLHKEAWEEEFVFHCTQKLLMLFFSPSLGYK